MVFIPSPKLYLASNYKQNKTLVTLQNKNTIKPNINPISYFACKTFRRETDQPALIKWDKIALFFTRNGKIFMIPTVQRLSCHK